MATNNQAEAQLIIRARQVGLSTIDSAAKSVANLTDKLDDQSKAYDRGEASAKELTSTLNDLEKAGEKLISQAGIVDSFNKRAEAIEDTAKRIEDAKQAEQDYATVLAGSEEVTSAQIKSLNALGGAVTRLERQLVSQNAQLEKARVDLAAIGVNAEEVATGEARIGAASMQVAGAIKAVNLLLVDFEDNLQRVQRAERELADNASLGETVAQFKGLRQAAEYTDFWSAAIQRGDVAILDFREKAESALLDFQKLGEAAITNSAKMDAFARSTTVAGAEASTFAKQILGIIDPASSARATLDGLEVQVAAIAEQVGEADKPLRTYTESINGLSSIDAAIKQQAKLISQFEDQKAAVAEATSAYQSSIAAVDAHTAAIRAADAPDQTLISNLKEAQNELRQTSAALVVEENELTKLGSRLEAAGINTNDLIGAQQRLIAVSRTSAQTSDKLSTAISGANNPAGKFLGLKPYELQNLGYQINDVFTQLASGTSVLQTLAQQGGQIGQIFPGAFTAIVEFAPYIAAVVAIVAPLFIGLKRVYDLRGEARDFNTQLSATADAALYQVDALAKASRALQDYGVSSEAAHKAIQEFVTAGLDPTRLNQFAKAANDLAKVTGETVPNAAKLLAEGFTGGYESIAKLDDQLHFLTKTERENIKAEFDANNASQARGEGLDALTAKYSKAAQAARSDWGEALHELGNAWRYFQDQLANSAPVQIIVTIFDAMGRALKNLLSGFSDARVQIDKGLPAQAGPQAAPQTGATIVSHRAGLNNALLGQPNGPVAPPASTGPAQANNGPVNNQESEAAKARAEDILSTQKDELALQRAIADSNDAEVISLTRKLALREAYNKKLDDGAAKQYADQAASAKQADLDKKHVEQLVQLQQQVQSSLAASAASQDASLQQRLDAINAQAKLTAGQIDLLARNGAPAAQVTAARQQLAVQTAQLATAAQMKFYEDQLAEVEKTRTDLLKTAGDELAIHAITQAQYAAKVQQANDLLVPKIKSIANDAERFAAGLGEAAKNDPKIIDFIQKFKDADLQAQAEGIADILKGMESSVSQLAGAQKSGVAEIMAQYSENAIDAATALKELVDLTNTLGKNTAAAAKAAADYAASNKAIASTPEGQGFIAKNNAIAAQATATGPNSILGKAQSQISTAEFTKVNQLVQDRNSLTETYDALAEQGAITTQQAEDEKAAAFAKTTPAIQAQIDATRALIETQKAAAEAAGQSTTAYDAMLAKLKLIGVQTTYINKDVASLNKSINDSFATEAVNAFDSIGQALGNAVAGTESWGDALSDVGRAAANFFASFLKDIAEAILKIEALHIAEDLLGPTGGGAGGIGGLLFGGAGAGATLGAGADASSAFAGATASASAGSSGASWLGLIASLFHNGTGGSPMTRTGLSPSLWDNAPRYHSGTPGAGLNPGEMAAILKQGEEVLTEDDPNHIKNRNKKSNAAPALAQPIKQVLVLDPADINKVSAGSGGEQVFMTHLVANKATIRQVLGVKGK